MFSETSPLSCCLPRRRNSCLAVALLAFGKAGVWRDATNKRLVVAFRGTEEDRWKDFATDVNFLLVRGWHERWCGLGRKREFGGGGGRAGTVRRTRRATIRLTPKGVPYMCVRVGMCVFFTTSMPAARVLSEGCGCRVQKVITVYIMCRRI